MEGPGKNESRLARFIRKGREAMRGRDSDETIHLHDHSHLNPHAGPFEQNRKHEEDERSRTNSQAPTPVVETPQRLDGVVEDPVNKGMDSGAVIDPISQDPQDPAQEEKAPRAVRGRPTISPSIEQLKRRIREKKSRERRLEDRETQPTDPDTWTQVVRPETAEDLESELRGNATAAASVSYYLDSHGNRRTPQEFEDNAGRYKQQASEALQQSYDEARGRKDYVSPGGDPEERPETNERPRTRRSRTEEPGTTRAEANRQERTRGPSNPDASPHRIRDDDDNDAKSGTDKPWETVDKRRYNGIKKLTDDEVFRSEEGQQYFGSMLHKLVGDRADDIFLRMKEGELSKEEEDIISYVRNEHGLFVKNRDRIAPKIDDSLIKRLALRDDQLNKLMESRSANVVARAMKEQLMKSAIEDPQQFEDFVKSMQTMEVAERSVFYKRYEKRIHALADAVGIKDSEMDGTFNLKDKKGREKTFEWLVNKQREDMGRVRKALDTVLSGLENGIGGANGTYFPLPKFLQFSSEGKARAWMNEAEKLQTQTKRSIFRPNSLAVNDVSKALNLAASFASKTLVEDKEVRAAMRQAAFEEGNKTGIRNTENEGPQNMQTYNQAKNISEAEIKEQWKQDREKAPLIDGDGWNEYTQSQREDFRESWTQREQQKHVEGQKGKGIFASILRAFIRALFNRNKEKLSVN